MDGNTHGGVEAPLVAIVRMVKIIAQEKTKGRLKEVEIVEVLNPESLSVVLPL